MSKQTTCLAPIVVKKNNRKTSKDYATDIFPCGKCPACVKRRVAGWTFRLLEELKVSQSAMFITLTYSDETIPYSENGLPTLDKTDYQKFMKRFRKRITSYVTKKEDIPKLKYYAAGEYGTQTNRPHYHAIIFNSPQFFIDHPDVLCSIWSNGQIVIDKVTAASIAYVAGYCMKKVEGTPVGIDEGDDRNPEFSLMSKKMGLEYITPAKLKYYKENLEPYLLVEGGQKISMPRYFKDKMFTESERNILNEKALKHLEKNGFNSAKEEYEYKKYQFFKAKLKSKQSRNTI